jgi:hypothetical protein
MAIIKHTSTHDAAQDAAIAADQIAMALKAPLASPAFTGTVSGITASMIGLGNVNNTSDAAKPISTATQTALDLKANQTSVVSILATQATDESRITALETATALGYTWEDLICVLQTSASGGKAAPTSAGLNGGNCTVKFYGVGTGADLSYHILHDWVPNSEAYIHLHWGHNGTAISGSLTVQITLLYAKGHNQSSFPAERVFNMVIPATNLTVAPRYGHIVSEVPIIVTSPSAVQLAAADIEVDGIILVDAKVISNPTITGGTPNNPYWIGIDIHYLSTSHGTKNRAPNFYV